MVPSSSLLALEENGNQLCPPEEEITFLGNFVYILLGSPETVKGTSVALPVVFCLFYRFFS